MITNSTFTPEAEELARIHGIELVDGKLLRLRLQETLRDRQAELLVCAAVRSWVWNVDVVTRCQA